MTTHEIISAIETAADGITLQIRWGNDGITTTTTTERVSEQAARALGYQRPDPQPVDPAWMVEVAREANAAGYDAANATAAAAAARTGERDHDIGATTAIRALRLALSRGHVVLAPVMPSEEEMLRDAREDVLVRALERIAAYSTISGMHDQDRAPKLQCIALAAPQARRNVYASLGAVKELSSGPVAPEVDLRGVANKAWANGFTAAIDALQNFGDRPDYQVEREKDVSAIIGDIKSGEA